MPKVPYTNPSFEDIRNAVISTGGSVPAANYGMDDLRAAGTWEFFVPANLNGAANISQITSVDQWRGYPRDRWGNQERSGSFQKQCSGDGTGSWHTYTVPANTYYSFDSQEAANTLAQNDVNTNGQAYANSVSGGYCTWYNDEMSQTYYKQGCGYRGEGSSYYHTLAAGAVSSTASKGQANAAGQSLMDSQGQAHVNANGYCTWRSEARAESIQRNNCGSGYTGSYVTVSASENQFSSTASLADANGQRDWWMQNQANTNGTCSVTMYYSEYRNATIYRDNCGYKGEGSGVTVIAVAEQFGSSESVAAANAARDQWMQWYANQNGYCTWYSEARSASLQKDNCGSGYTGTYVNVGASENQFNSTTSLAAANASRDAAMQYQANQEGSCLFDNQMPTPSVSIQDLGLQLNYHRYKLTITNLYPGYTFSAAIVSGSGNTSSKTQTTVEIFVNPVPGSATVRIINLAYDPSETDSDPTDLVLTY